MTYPNYDSYFHLLWGRDLLAGHLPSVQVYAAPTQHPLYVIVSALLGAVFGEDGDRALVVLCLLAQLALLAGVYRLGRAIFGRWPGVAAALFVAASASFWLYALRGYVDSPFLALVVWAAVREAEGRRGALRMLVVAGLLRPEAWVLAFALAAWRRSPGALVLAALAPALWALSDLALTGDPLHSLHATSELADDLRRQRGIGHVPGAFAGFLWSTVRPPVLLLGAIGAVLAIRRRAWVPLALLGAGAATFVGTGLFGLSILPRYLTVPAIALCVLAGYALAGFTTLARGHPLRRRWRAGAAVAVVLAVAALPLLAPSTSRVRAELRFIAETHRDLVALLDDPRVRAATRCGPLTFPTYRLVPDARWHLDDAGIAVSARSHRRERAGVEVFTTTEKALRRYGFAQGVRTATTIPATGWTPLPRHGMFSAFARCPPAPS